MINCKTGLIFTCLIICFFSIASVCASDVNENVTLSNNQNIPKIVSTDENGLDASEGTFTDLEKEINKMNGELNLTKNYRFNPDCDQKFENRGIHVWNSSIIINGNGHTIDGNNQARAFEFFGSNITVKNLKVVNGFASEYRYAGAISFRDDNCTLLNCTFINNYAGDGGGAVHLEHENHKIINCTFINNSAIRYDGAMSSGGAIEGYSCCSNCIVANCTFINNTSYKGGAVRWYGGSNVSVVSCRFINNTDFKNDYGSTIYWGCKNGTIIDSYFDNPTFYDIYSNEKDNLIIDCNCSRTNLPVFHKSFIKIIADDVIDFGETLILKTSVVSGATGDISIYVNDVFRKKVNVGGTCYLSDLNAGINIIKAVYSGDDYYVSCENITNVGVNKIDSSIIMDNIIVVNYSNSYSIPAAVEGASSVYAYVVNQSDAIVDVGNNKITISNLDVGNYTLFVVAYGDDNHFSLNTTSSITVLKSDSSIYIPTIRLDHTQSATVTVKLDGAIGIVNVKVKNHPEALIYINGSEITVSRLDEGKYVLSATTIPDKNHNAVKGTATIIVNKTISASDSDDSDGANKVKNNSNAVIRDDNVIHGLGLNATINTLSDHIGNEKTHNLQSGSNLGLAYAKFYGTNSVNETDFSGSNITNVSSIFFCNEGCMSIKIMIVAILALLIALLILLMRKVYFRKS